MFLFGMASEKFDKSRRVLAREVVALSFIPSLVLAICVVFIGAVLCRRVKVLNELALPAAVVGGVAYLLVMAFLSHFAEFELELSPALRRPFMLIFFASVGLGAGLAMLKKGGGRVMLFLAVAVGLLVAQNGAGVLGAKLFELPPFLGLIFGSVTLSGGHGTGLAWAETFETLYGTGDLESLALAAATVGVVAGGMVGGPVASFLIRRHKLKPPSEAALSAGEREHSVLSSDGLLGHFLLLLACVAAAEIMPTKLSGFTVPTFLWAIITGILLRAVMDGHPSLKRRFQPRAVADMGEGALAIFIATAMAGLSWGEISAVWLPMTTIIAAQVLLAALFAATVTFKVMGGDYTAAVMAAGHCGFGLGSTPNAVNNMLAVSRRYGVAPGAMLVVPLVGAFFIDIANALVLEAFINLF